MDNQSLPIPGNARQIAFHELLVLARRDWLTDALVEALSRVEPQRVRDEQTAYVPADVHLRLATAGIPDEYVFPLPVVIEAKPTLVGYYRLLLGLPRKTFYGPGTGMGKLRVLEENGTLGKSHILALPGFCAAMSTALADLVRQLAPTVTRRDLIELPVMTLGQQFQGANNNAIGSEAIAGVFRSLREIAAAHTVSETETSISVSNHAGRTLRIVLASDPDVGIVEERDGKPVRRLALEVKGGSDRSNQHNRIGEAEKSHVKAKAEGYADFWTVIRTTTLDDAARRQSPTTRLWFDAAQVLARSGPEWEDFAHEIAHILGIPDPTVPRSQPAPASPVP